VATPPKGLILVRLTAGAGPADPATRAAARVVAALTPELRAKIRTLVVESPTNIRLELAGGVVVVWGDAERSDVKAMVATALLSQARQRIDVSAPEVAAVS
jgi:cell division protein FtsQ